MPTPHDVAAYLIGLSHRLKVPSVFDVHPVTVIIRGKTYPGAAYKSAPHGDTETSPYRLYLIGNRPIPRRKSSCYHVNGNDWYIATYMMESSLAEHKHNKSEEYNEWARQYHPFGASFVLMQWNAPEPIDYYERHKYERIPMSIEFV